MGLTNGMQRTEKKIFTIGDAPQEVLARAGAFVLWRLSGNVDVIAMNKAWLDSELDPHHCPGAPSEEVAHHRAVKEHARAGVLCSKIRDGGWALVGKQDVKDEAGADLKFSTNLRVWRAESFVHGLKFEPADDPRRGVIEAAYTLHQRTLSTIDISVWLVRQAERLDAVPLRDTGGVYFIPHKGLEEWTKIVHVLRAVSSHKIFNVPALEEDADSIALIMDGVMQEAESMMADLGADLSKVGTDSALGERAWVTRKDRLVAFEDKLKRYEALLGTKLDKTRSALETFDTQISTALVACAAEAAK